MRTLAAFLVLIASCSTAPDPTRMDDQAFDRELERQFQYSPPEPAPREVADQAWGQAADAAYFATFPDYDRAYTPASREMARELAATLRNNAATLSHEQFVLAVAEIAALADNAHTAIGENAFKKNTSRLPIRTYLFADGLHVLWSAPAQRDLLGARIDTIDGRGIDDIYRVIRRYQGGTEPYRRARLVPMLESPALLHAAGVADARDALTIRGVLADGAPFERRLEGEERDRSAWVSSTQRTLYPRGPGGPMISYLADDAELPLYLRSRDVLFATGDLPQGGYYIGLAYNADGDEEPIGPFLNSALTHIRAHRPAFVVLDMRMNGGGDYTKTYAFARALPEAAGAAQIYVLTSAYTFSAAITTVAALEDTGGDQVTIVGDHVGDRLDFWAEGGAFNLPNAFVQVHYASGRHVYNGPCRDRRTCFWLNERYPVRVSSLAPDISAPMTFAAYRDLHDPAIDTVLARESSRGSPGRTR